MNNRRTEMNGLVSRASAKWLRLKHATSGAAAVEFALFAPALILGVLVAVDLGLAVHERMTIDHVLRSGAQAAMVDPGEEDVRDILQSTASKNFSNVADGGGSGTSGTTISTGSDALTLTVGRYCTCPESIGTEVTCSTTCEGTVPTYIYYKLEAAKQFDGMIIPTIPIDTDIEVQVR